jgi:hypothetical protein
LTVAAFKCIKETVLRIFFHYRIPIALLIAGVSVSPLRADDSKPVARPGYRLVAIKGGDKTAYIEVRDTSNPYSQLKDTGPDHGPQHFSFGQTSSMADKTYSLDTASSAYGGKYQDQVQSGFLTKSYFDKNGNEADHSMPGLNTPVPLPSADGYVHHADGFDRSFSTKSDDEQNRASALGTMSASEAHQEATLGGHAVQAYAYNDSNHTYLGPEAGQVHHDLDRMNHGLETLKDLPDRALTIDEVRALINHGVKPDLAKPSTAEPTKPLNDPSYLPDAAPAPMAPSAPDHLQDSSDLSTPGATAHPEMAVPPPENSQPLPQ